MKALNEMNLVMLKDNDAKAIDGGVLLGPWGPVIKAARYLLEAAGAIDAVSDFKDGYQDCRCTQ